MYRVELKDRGFYQGELLAVSKVPNVPCGVESTLSLPFWKSLTLLFLMYRVELKEGLGHSLLNQGEVPNVPCGVESIFCL